MSSFEAHVAAFYVSLAEEKLEDMCESLHHMRLEISQTESTLNDQTQKVYQEILQSCEEKSLAKTQLVNDYLIRCCSSTERNDSTLQKLLSAVTMCLDLGMLTPNDQKVKQIRAFLTKHFQMKATIVYESVCKSKNEASANEFGYIERNFYVEGLNEILNSVMGVAKALMEIVEGNEHEHALYYQFMSPVHALCVEVTLEIVHLFTIEGRMEAWERRALEQARLQAVKKDIPIELDESLQMMDLFLDEMTCVVRLLCTYQSCIRSFRKSITMEQKPKEQEASAALPVQQNTASLDRFDQKTYELNGIYMLLERFYIFQSVHKATEIAEVQTLEKSIFISSVVEDTSFVLSKVLMRACQCIQYPTTLSVVSAVVDALDSMYLPAILQLPNRQLDFSAIFAKAGDDSVFAERKHEGKAQTDQDQSENASFSDLLLQIVDDDLTRELQKEAKLIMAINSAFISCQIVSDLATKIGDISDTVFSHESNLLECLPRPISELNDTFIEVVNNEISSMIHSTIKPQIEPLLHDCLETKCHYVLSSAEFDRFGVQPSPLTDFMERYVVKNKILMRYQQSLCHEPFQSLIEAFAKEITTWLEDALIQLQPQMNELGALQFEREVSDLLIKISSFVKTKSIRSHFTRLFHMTLILNFLQPDDVVNSYQPRSTNGEKELDSSTLAALLQMRIEFDSAAIGNAVQKWNEEGENIRQES
uniref:Uncharacterized protein AlNc14C51G3989 n=1 Tax=Albugo laibachii Nc14 TaxID=890382 RepID=F0WBE2_9STRA|nr:conserved hypothetical protein [Albugo laibachii Nc14]|eukprot:CCA18466.1 conserved hypothetical protein [Albugo laibachii Nc14]